MSRDLKNKMLNYEVSPPGVVWDRLSVQLDELRSDKPITSRLRELEVTPPQHNWDKIRQKLSGNEAGQPSLLKKFPVFVRYAAAAVLLAFVIWAGINLLDSDPRKDTLTQQTKAPLPGDKPQSPSVSDQINSERDDLDASITPDEIDRDDAALEASKRTYARLDKPVISKIKNAANFYFSSASELSGNSIDAPVSTDYPIDEKTADRYVLLLTPDGNVVRFSKKLGSYIPCVYGKVQDEKCIKQVKEWREKLATSSSGLTPGNFMDILQLVNSLQENNQN